ncbi:MAG: DsrE family protein [Flavobacteriaceae bacterium]
MKSVFFLLSFIVFNSITAQQWVTPVVEGYGEIQYFKEAQEQPHADQDYKIIFDITSDAQKNGVNKGLWKVARMLNMFGVVHQPKDKIHLAVALHGEASYVVLSEKNYQARFNKPNPNLDLIQKLKENGVELYVCSQAIATRKISHHDLNPAIVPALSAMSVLANYQIKGYHIMP